MLFVHFSLISLLLSILATTAHADVDDCDDYLARHFKQDLKPVALSFTSHEWSGDIRWPHQKIKILVKNVGQVTLGENQSGFHPINVRIGSRVETASIKLPLASGAQTHVYLSLPEDSLRRCLNYFVAVDTSRNIGQWGCQVFSNDTATLTAQYGSLGCRYRP